MSKSSKPSLGSSDIAMGDAPGDVEMIGIEDVETVATPRARGVLAEVDSDGLPVIDPVAAAGRALDHVRSKGLGPRATQVIEWIATRAVDTADLNAVILERLAESIVTAESPEDILMPFEPSHGRDYLDRPMVIHGVEYLESDYAEGFPWFATATVTLVGEREQRTVTLGGEKVLYQIAGFDMHDAWPVTVRLCESRKATKQGFRPLELRSA